MKRRQPLFLPGRDPSSALLKAGKGESSLHETPQLDYASCGRRLAGSSGRAAAGDACDRRVFVSIFYSIYNTGCLIYSSVTLHSVPTIEPEIRKTKCRTIYLSAAAVALEAAALNQPVFNAPRTSLIDALRQPRAVRCAAAISSAGISAAISWRSFGALSWPCLPARLKQTWADTKFNARKCPVANIMPSSKRVELSAPIPAAIDRWISIVLSPDLPDRKLGRCHPFAAGAVIAQIGVRTCVANHSGGWRARLLIRGAPLAPPPSLAGSDIRLHPQRRRLDLAGHQAGRQRRSWKR
jgi:hypothetical protein